MNTEQGSLKFSKEIRNEARKRANGFCQHPLGCEEPNDNTIDHFTGMKLGKLLGMSPAVIRSIDNAQMLCKFHNKEKTAQEMQFILMMEEKLKKPAKKKRNNTKKVLE